MDSGKRPDKIARESAALPAEPIGTVDETIGRVKWWLDAKGYGAISTEKTAPWDIWCHFSHVQATGFRALAPGDSVHVQYVRSDRESFRYVARSVRRVQSADGNDATDLD
jgi:cold shock CspA family protein